MFDVITIGSAIRDVFLPLGDINDYHKNFELLAHADLGNKINLKSVYFATGGGGTNTAFTFKNLGFRTAVFTVIGDDESGKEILKELRRNGINTDLVKRIKKGKTAYSVIILSPQGERTAFVFRGVSDFKAVTYKSFKARTAKWFYLASLGGNFNLLKEFFIYAQQRKINILWNPGGLELALGLKKLRGFLKKTQILLVNKEEAQKLLKKSTDNLKELVQKLQAISGNLVVVTDGKNGAGAGDGKFYYQIPTIPVKVVNATGAGDAFGSGFLASMIKSVDIETALKIGIINSTSVIQKMGAKNGIINKWPNKEQLSAVAVKKMLL